MPEAKPLYMADFLVILLSPTFCRLAARLLMSQELSLFLAFLCLAMGC